MLSSDRLKIYRFLCGRAKVALLGGTVLTLAMFGVKPAPGQQTGYPFAGVPHDWSHHHLVFSQPLNAAEALKLQAEPRYWHQWFYRNIKRQVPVAVNVPSFVKAEDFPPITLPVKGGEKDKGGGGERFKPAALHNDWSMSMGTAATGVAEVYPAKYTFSTSASSCSDFVVFPTGVAGSTTVPSIIAYNNLYSGCTGTKPTIYWQANINGLLVQTSPVLSSDGTEVAFMAGTGTAGTSANLVVLKMPNANSASVTQITTSTATINNGTQGATPVAWFAAFADSDALTISSPFYDYTNNVLYVGDDAGYLHKFQTVFHKYGSGTTQTTAPAEVTSGFPDHMATGALTGPVLDGVSGNVFVAVSATTDSTGGRFHYIPSTGTASNAVASGQVIAAGSTEGPPVVDSQAQRVYIFVNDDTGNTNICGTGSSAGVYQFTTTFAANNCGTEVTIGQGSATGITYAGSFDNIYFASASESSPSGNLYVCGRASGSQTPTIYRIPITGNVMGTPVAGPPLATGTPDCSPVTEILGGATDYIFVSVAGAAPTASPISCPSGNTGCIMSFTVTNTTGWGASKATTTTLGAPGGTSAIVIDNTVGSTSGDQVYYSLLGTEACAGSGGVGTGTTGCAVQADLQ